MRAHTRAILYLILSLCGLLIGGFLDAPFSSLCHLLFVLAALYTEKRLFAGEALPSLSPRALLKEHRLWLLLPPFLFFTLAINLLSAKITVSLGGKLPDMTPSLALFFGAVILAPIAEELVFRGLLLKLLRPFGDGWAIALSACLFAFAHGSLFQIPYALAAGVFLAYTALASDTLLFPVLFHFFYNLLAFFGKSIPPLPFLQSLGGLAAFSLILFFLGKKPSLKKSTGKPDTKMLFLLILYCIALLALAILSF